MSTSIITNIVPITPKELYLNMIQGTFEGMRQANAGMSYIPAQYGGIFGQQVVLDKGVAMEVVTFSVN